MKNDINDFERPEDWTEHDEAVRNALILGAIRAKKEKKARQARQAEADEKHRNEIIRLMNGRGSL